MGTVSTKEDGGGKDTPLLRADGDVNKKIRDLEAANKKLVERVDKLEGDMVAIRNMKRMRCCALKRRPQEDGAKPRKGKMRRIVGIPLVAVVLVLLTGCTVRHFTRGKELKPFLDSLIDATTCKNETLSGYSCAKVFSKGMSSQFDMQPGENALFGFLDAQVTDGDRQKIGDVLCGAHVEIDDPSKTSYNFLTNLPGAYKRISSHSSDAQQYGINEGRIVHTILVGTLGDKTWFQLEGAAWDVHDIRESAGHVFDTCEYFVTRRNIGPLGTSIYTDKNSLELGKPDLSSHACPQPCQ